MTKAQTAALGFRVKSGWAAVVLLTGTSRSPQLSDIGQIELCDPRFPETRQPYHAAMGKLETDSAKINQRQRVVRSISQQSLRKLLKGYQQKGFRIKRAELVVGSLIDPAEIRTDLLLERDGYSRAAERLKRSIADLKRAIQDLGRSAPAKGGPWRAEQKLAPLAALSVLG